MAVNMKNAFKLVVLSVFALVLALSGSAAARHEPDSSGSQRCAFAPAVRKDAAMTVAVCLEKERLFKVADVFLDHLFDIVEIESAEDVEKWKLAFGEFKKDPFGQLDVNSRKFLRENGLYDVNMRWGVFSMDAFSIVKGEIRAQKGLSLAIAGNFDLEKIVKGVHEKSLRPLCDNVDFEVMTVAGEKAWRVRLLDTKMAKEFKETGMDPCMASLDGQLVLVAQSPEVLAQLIRLYRHGEGKGDVLGDFPVGTDLMRVFVSDVGRCVQESAGDKLQQLNETIPNGDKIVAGLKTLAVDVKASPEGKLQRISIILDAASEQDADVLRTFAKAGLTVLRAQMAEKKSRVNVEDRPFSLQVMKILEGVTINGENGRIEFSSDGSLVVVCAASAYYVGAAMGRAIGSFFADSRVREALREMKAGGESLGRGLIKSHAATSRAYGSATDYFNALFDMAHYGTSEWAPLVEGKLLGALGKDAVVDKTLRAEGLNWCIAANVTDDTPDFMPILISANFNPALLPRKWDGRTNRFTRLPIGSASGAAKSMLDDKFIVVVRKDGSVRTIKAENLTYFLLFCRKAFDLSGKAPPLVYLTPTGIVTPGALMEEERKN